MAGGQSTASAQGTITYGLSVALVGLAITVSHGTVTATGSDAAGLTGQSSTTEQGTVTQRADVSLTGLSGTLSQGQVGPRGRSLIATFSGTTLPDLRIPLSGQSVSTLQGVVVAGEQDAPALTGQSLTSVQQSLTATLSQALTGAELTSTAGTLAVSSQPLTIPGQTITSEQGVVDPSGFTVTVHLSGVECTAFIGSVDATPVLTGAAITSAAGTVTHDLTVALIGQELLAAQGPTIVEQNADDLFIQSSQGTTGLVMTVALLGEAMTGEQGTVTLNDGEQGIIGSEATSALGTVTGTVSCELVGQELVSAQYPFGAPGGATLTGLVLTSLQGEIFTDNDRTMALTGSSMTATLGILVPDLRQAMLSNLLNSSTGNIGSMGGNKTQALTGLAITVSRGTFGVIGQDPVLQTPSLEGCGITSGVALESVTGAKTASSEGCFITSNRANEVA